MANMFHIIDSNGYSIGVIECPFPQYSEGADYCVTNAIRKEKGSYVARSGSFDYYEINSMEDVTEDIKFLGYFD